MSTRDNNEFEYALQEIATYSVDLENPYDRVRCAEWMRKLASIPDDDLELSKLRNHYIQYLRIQVRNRFLHGPFLQSPTEDTLCALPAMFGIVLHRITPLLPEAGPISPMMCQTSPDGRAFVSCQQVPEGGVLCYMAVSPSEMPAMPAIPDAD